MGWELEQIEGVVGADAVTRLVGENATLSALEMSIDRARALHFATHGLPGSRRNAFEAGLVLSSPEVLSSRDFGVLTLEHLIREWRGSLDGCEIVVLSACETQRANRVGDAAFTLTWGFLYAGAETVVASLWRVDDLATALLMKELYHNLEQGMTRIGALSAAQETLRTLSRAAVEERVGRLPDALGSLARRGLGQKRRLPAPAEDEPRPFEHPYYWAGFVIVGAPD